MSFAIVWWALVAVMLRAPNFGAASNSVNAYSVRLTYLRIVNGGAVNTAAFNSAVSSGIASLIGTTAVTVSVDEASLNLTQAIVDVGVMVDASSTSAASVHTAVAGWSVSAFPPKSLFDSNAVSLGSSSLSLQSLAATMPCQGPLYGNSTASPVPPCALTFTVTATPIAYGRLPQIVCAVMQLSTCPSSYLQLGATTASAAGPETTLYLSPSPSGDPLSSLATLVQKVRDKNFALQELNVISISLVEPVTQGKATIFHSDDVLYTDKPPSAAQACTAADYWWVIVLIIAVPFSFVLIRRAYTLGRRSGIDKEKDLIRNHQIVEAMRFAAPSGGQQVAVVPAPTQLQPQFVQQQFQGQQLQGYQFQAQQQFQGHDFQGQLPQQQYYSTQPPAGSYAQEQPPQY